MRFEGDRLSPEDMRQHLEEVRAFNTPVRLAEQFTMPIFGIAEAWTYLICDVQQTTAGAGELIAAAVNVRYSAEGRRAVVRSHRTWLGAGNGHPVQDLDSQLRTLLMGRHTEEHLAEILSGGLAPPLPDQVGEVEISVQGISVNVACRRLSGLLGVIVALNQTLAVSVAWSVDNLPPPVTIIAGLEYATGFDQIVL